MVNEKTEHLSRVLVVWDVALSTAAFLLAYAAFVAFGDAEPGSLLDHVALLPLTLAFIVYFLNYFDGYRSPRSSTRFTYGWAVARSVGASIILLLTLLFLLRVQYISRIAVVSFAGLALVFLTTARLVALWHFRRALGHGESHLKVLVIGTGPRAVRLAETLKDNDEWGLDILGHLDPDPVLVGSVVGDRPVLGTEKDISAILKQQVVDEVIVAVPRAMIADVDQIARACEEEGVRLRFMADVFDVHVARMRLADLDGIPLLTMEAVAQEPGPLMVKRTIDLAVTLLILPVLVPLCAIIALAIKLDSPGPALFVQPRVGLGKRKFPLLKFRTMVVDAESRLKEIEHLNEAEGPIFKIRNDPRVTRVGRILRRTSLDEIPQFFNVLRGDMSLVGPRPMSTRDVDLFDRGVQRRRFSVKPGLACLREVSGRSNLSFAEWLALDLLYIETWSLTLDLKVMLKAVPAVLRGHGAV